MVQKNVFKTQDGVNIKFTGSVEKKSVVSMIESCSSGECDCDCDPELFKRIEGMDVSGEDGDVTIGLKGNISADEISEAVGKCDISS